MITVINIPSQTKHSDSRGKRQTRPRPARRRHAGVGRSSERSIRARRITSPRTQKTRSPTPRRQGRDDHAHERGQARPSTRTQRRAGLYLEPGEEATVTASGTPLVLLLVTVPKHTGQADR